MQTHTCAHTWTHSLHRQYMFRIRKWGLPPLNSSTSPQYSSVCQEWKAIRKPLVWSGAARAEASSPVAPSHKTQLKMKPSASQTKAFCTVHPIHTTHTVHYCSSDITVDGTQTQRHTQTICLSKLNWMNLITQISGTPPGEEHPLLVVVEQCV